MDPHGCSREHPKQGSSLYWSPFYWLPSHWPLWPPFNTFSLLCLRPFAPAIHSARVQHLTGQIEACTHTRTHTRLLENFSSSFKCPLRPRPPQGDAQLSMSFSCLYCLYRIPSGGHIVAKVGKYSGRGGRKEVEKERRKLVGREGKLRDYCQEGRDCEAPWVAKHLKAFPTLTFPPRASEGCGLSDSCLVSFLPSLLPFLLSFLPSFNFLPSLLTSILSFYTYFPLKKKKKT